MRTLDSAVRRSFPLVLLFLMVAAGCASGDAEAKQQLRREIEQLRAENARLSELQLQFEEVKRLREDTQEIHRLRAQYQELTRLRKENAELRQRLGKTRQNPALR